jgi:preprotein translocase subunit YajC
MLFSTAAYAQGAGAPAGPGLIESLAPLVLIVVIFWFLILRPQQKKMKEHKEMVDKVNRGDTVVTAGGLIGKVAKVKDETEVEVDFGEGVRIRVVKSTLADVRVKGEPAKTDSK